MKTSELATHLASAAALFPFLSGVSTHDLLGLIHAELGNSEALDDFRSYGGHFAKAVGPGTILHVLSGHPPAPALLSVMRGLLLGSHNLCRVPSSGLRALNDFRRALPPELAARVEIQHELPDSWLGEADAVIVVGNDETIQRFRSQVRPGQLFMAFGPKLSFGVVFDDPDFASATGAARDISTAAQQGGVPPHVIYVAHEELAYAAKLAAEMERLQEREPHGLSPLSDANAIRNQRAEFATRIAADEPIALFQSDDSTGWSVAFDPSPGFPLLALPRIVHVKPLPENLAKTLRDARSRLGCAGIWPATLENAGKLERLGVSRICPLGQMAHPPATWHHDGRPVLAPLVRWIDAETAVAAQPFAMEVLETHPADAEPPVEAKRPAEEKPAVAAKKKEPALAEKRARSSSFLDLFPFLRR